AVEMVKKTPAYKNRLRALELERSGGIKGAEKPSLWGLLGVRSILLPYTLDKLHLWHACWFWRYKVKKAPYSWEDASYLTQRSPGAPANNWRNLDEATKDDLVKRQLWVKSNMEGYDRRCGENRSVEDN
ncbi:Chaperone protein dnaJ 50, partial [Bienertia sinuspersici]